MEFSKKTLPARLPVRHTEYMAHSQLSVVTMCSPAITSHQMSHCSTFYGIMHRHSGRTQV